MLQRLKLRPRLTLAFGLLLILMLLMAGAGLWSAQRFFLASQTLYQDRALPLAVNLATIDRQWLAYRRTGLDGAEAEAAQAFETRYQAYLKDALQPAATAMREGRYDDTADFVTSRVDPAAPGVQAGIQRLVALQVDESARQFEGTRALHQRLSLFLGVALLVALALGLAMAVRITRSITVPLAQAVDVARRVATGAAEIALGTADLSQRTESQAAGLQQTAAAMDGLNATVLHNAGTAGNARGLASRAGVLQWWPAKCAASRSAAQRRRRKSAISSPPAWARWMKARPAQVRELTEAVGVFRLPGPGEARGGSTLARDE